MQSISESKALNAREGTPKGNILVDTARETVWVTPRL
jgi:hypothetical protein